MFRVLIVGQDFSLLASRAAVLSTVGAKTVCCNPMEMVRDLLHEDFEVVVLCHSLDHAVTDSVAELARERWPQAKLVLVTTPLSGEQRDQSKFDATIPPEPRDLVEAAVRLGGDTTALELASRASTARVRSGGSRAGAPRRSR